MVSQLFLKFFQLTIRSEAKVEDNTINRLSYQEWQIGPKQQLPWVPKHCYQRPQAKMETDTVCRMSFAPPGQFIEECCEVA